MNRFFEEVAGLLGLDGPAPLWVDSVDVLPARCAVTELALGSVAVAAAAAAQLSHARGGPQPTPRVDGRRVSAMFRSDRLVRVDGQPVQGFAELSRFWPTRAGWVRTHGNYPHHRQRLLEALGLGGDAGTDDVGAVMASSTAAEVEEAVVRAGGVAAAVRTPQQWRDHPQGQALDGLPLVAIRRVGESGPLRLPPPPQHPLLPAAGIRVLDLTRVIAGPTATSTLALLGAEVLRLDAPQLPELPDMYVLTGAGKRSALLDLGAQPEVLDRLLATAEVVVTGYRPGSLDRHGLAADTLARRHPGLVVVALSAWGAVGPWGSRRGFDSIVQTATGIASIEADGSTPGALPAQALDYGTGFLLAAGALAALAGRQREGGTYVVEAGLARTAAWLLDHADTQQRRLPDVDDLLRDERSPVGLVRRPPPAVQFDDSPPDWLTPLGGWGADRPSWTASA